MNIRNYFCLIPSYTEMSANGAVVKSCPQHFVLLPLYHTGSRFSIGGSGRLPIIQTCKVIFASRGGSHAAGRRAWEPGPLVSRPAATGDRAFLRLRPSTSLRISSGQARGLKERLLRSRFRNQQPACQKSEPTGETKRKPMPWFEWYGKSLRRPTQRARSRSRPQDPPRNTRAPSGSKSSRPSLGV
jgi:hypothetical protein